MDEFAEGRLLLAFAWCGHQVQLRASARGWADLFLRENPWTNRRRCSKAEWEARALEQGMIAVNSILRDWVRGQITAIETGMVEFRHVFLPYMDGKRRDGGGAGRPPRQPGPGAAGVSSTK